MFPATVGMISLAYPLNTLFYEPSHLGSSVLIEACISGVVIGLYMMSSSTLQGLGKHKATLKYLVLGFIIKVLLQVPFIYFFEVYGPLLATTVGLGLSTFLILRDIHEISNFDLGLVLRRALLILLLCMGMLVTVLLSRFIFGLFLSPEHKITSFILVLLVAGVGGVTYMILSLKIRLADKLLGRKVAGLRRKLHIK